MDAPIRIVMIEDVATDAELAEHALRRSGLRVEIQRVETRDAYENALAASAPDLILSDYSLPKFDGISALTIAHQHYPDIPFIFVSGTMGEQTAIDALTGGASDYVLKTNLVRLPTAVRRALSDVRIRLAHRQAESRFRDLIEFAPDAMIVLNGQGRIEVVNAQAERLFGYDRDEIVGASSEMLIPLRYQQWHERVDGRAQGGAHAQYGAVGFEVHGLRRDGSEFPLEVSLSPLQTEHGFWFSSVIRDVSERKAQEERLARLSRLHRVMSGINTAIVRIRERQPFLEEACRIAVENGEFAAAWIGMLDAHSGTVLPQAWAGVDEAALKQLQISVDETQPRGLGCGGMALRSKSTSVSNDVLGDPRQAPWHAFYEAHGFRAQFVVPLLVGGVAIGVLYFYSTSLNVFNEGEQRLLAELGEDISFALDRFEKDERLTYLAYFDPLTGLPNRALFLERLGQLLLQEASAGGRLAIVLLDLERFRNVNTTLGRGAGDDLLKQAAVRIGECLRDARYLARISADSYAFVVRDCEQVADLTTMLERDLAARLAEPIRLLDQEIRLSARAGIALFPADGGDADTLLRNAEAALKNAKTSRSRHRLYAPEMNERVAETLSIESRLRRALNEEQFVLYYQPKIDLMSGALVGLEALIRWNEPDLGLVPPGDFIYVLEETGLIVDVGNWVIARAHRQYQDWTARGIKVPRIAVNVSQLQIRQKNFVENVLSLLDPVDPNELEIEITESLFMEDLEQNVEKLVALRERGITVAIDDFGTGYSSLSNIMHLPIDVLKIDRSFITGMTASADHLAIVSTLISLAHSFYLKVVAEGVETNEQSHLLKLLRCDQIQGYLYSPGLPPEKVEDLLEWRLPIQPHLA